MSACMLCKMIRFRASLVVLARYTVWALVSTSQVGVKIMHKSILPSPPPWVLSVPVLCGNMCLIADENFNYYACKDSCPPLGAPISATGVVDSEVKVIEDTRFGTRFYLDGGRIRGRLCPGGGTSLPGVGWLASKWLNLRHRDTKSREEASTLETCPVTLDDEGWLWISVDARSSLLGDQPWEASTRSSLSLLLVWIGTILDLHAAGRVASSSLHSWRGRRLRLPGPTLSGMYHCM